MHLTLAMTIVLSGSPGPAAWPESLSKPLLARVEPFVWPKPKVFDSKWTEATAHDAGKTLLRLNVGGKPQWYVVSPSEDYGAFRLDQLTGDETRFTDSVTGKMLKVWSWERENTTELEVLERLNGTVTPDALVPWTHVNTLVESNGPLYADTMGDAPELRELVRSFRDAPEAEQLAKIVTWAKANKADAALFERFRSFRPRGSCSMDTMPQSAARVFGELAFARGDLGRFLQLQINIMGDNFERNAWSSYGEAAHRTEVERLVSTGIELDQFLLGLAVGTQDSGPRLGAWRLARAIQEAGREATLLPKLEALATSPKLDAYNRLSATRAWFFVQVRDEAQSFKRDEKAEKARMAQRDQVIARALKLPLHPIAIEWLKAP